MRVLVIGGTGFIGRHVVARLVTAGHAVYVPTRLYQHGRDLLVQPSVNLLEADVHDDQTLERLVGEAEAVINLVGILHSRSGQPFGADFARAHVELPRRIAQACVKLEVRRLLHVSALGASVSAPSGYQRSKAAGEKVLTQVFDSFVEGAYTIFRPSVVFGPEDNFMNMFARLARWLPVVPLAGAKARLQPVYVGDVADVIAGALNNPHTYGRRYTVAGMKAYTLGELVSLAARWSGHPRFILPLPMAIGRLQAMVFEWLPGEPIMSRDNLDSLKVDNVSTDPMAPELGVIPRSLEAIAPGYLRRRGG